MATILSKVWIGILLFLVLMCPERAKSADMNLEQMSNEELVQLMVDPKWGDNAAWEVDRRLEESNYNQNSELAELLFQYWRESDKEWVRIRCFRGLKTIKSHKAVDVLTSQLLQGSTRYDRKIAAKDLGEIGSATAISALESAVRADEGVLGPGRSIARESIFALGKIGSPAVPTLMKIWNDRALRRDCEEAVVSAMGLTKDMRFAPVLVGILDGKEELIRDNAAWALGEIGDDTLLPKLREYQDDSNKKVKENVLEAIRKIEQRIQNSR